jgi:hypothetical protein
MAEQLIGEAIRARHHRQEGDFERCRDLLTAGPGNPAGVQAVNRALLATLLHEVDQAWRRGWQPSEIVRAARREYTARHGRLATDVIAAKMRDYSAATVPPRWQMQLVDLDAGVWWQQDDQFLSLWGDKHGADRTATVETMIDMLLLLVTMQPVESTSPMPGAAEAAANDADQLDQRILDRVRALLAKAESTDYPDEAETYSAKAQELMTRHRIDHALLAAKSNQRVAPATRRVPVDNPYEAPKSLLLQVVAEANSCRAVWMKRFGLVSIIGFAADLAATELLFTSLLVQATRAMTVSGTKIDGSGRNTTRSFRQSFLTSYATRVGERLSTASEKVTQEAAASEAAPALLPVLAARSDAVRDAVTEQFPDLTHVATAANNREGWAAGRAAADWAILHGQDEIAPQ